MVVVVVVVMVVVVVVVVDCWQPQGNIPNSPLQLEPPPPKKGRNLHPDERLKLTPRGLIVP